MINIKQLDRICLGILLTTILITGYLVVHYLEGKKQQLGTENQILSKRIQEVDLATTNLEELKTVLNESKEELAALNERIPNAGKMGLFLQQVNSLMLKRSVSLISLQPLSTGEEDNYLKLPIRLVFSGKYKNIYQFLYDLENINRIVVLEQIEITRTDNSNQCQVDLLVKVFERNNNT